MYEIDIEKLKISYEKNQSITRVGKEFGISRETVRRRLKPHNILNQPKGKKKYTCNDNFFSHDTPESFYWAGFIAADGCVLSKGENHKIITITLAEKDHGHLKKFKDSISFTGPILKSYAKLNNKTYKQRTISINSIKIFNDLKRFGIKERKSLTFKLPKIIQNHTLVNHFFRGYIDGDGSWAIRTRNNRQDLKLKLLGTKSLLQSFKKVLFNKCNISNKQKISSDGNIYRVEINGANQIKRVRDFIYTNINKNIVLDRKHKIAFDKCLYKPNIKRGISYIGINNNGKIIFLESQVDGKKYGFNPSNISNCCSGRQKTCGGFKWRKASKDDIKKYR